MLDPEEFEKLQADLPADVSTDPTELAAENVLALLTVVREVAGGEAALHRLTDQAVLRATLTQNRHARTPTPRRSRRHN